MFCQRCVQPDIIPTAVNMTVHDYLPRNSKDLSASFTGIDVLVHTLRTRHHYVSLVMTISRKCSEMSIEILGFRPHSAYLRAPPGYLDNHLELCMVKIIHACDGTVVICEKFVPKCSRIHVFVRFESKQAVHTGNSLKLKDGIQNIPWCPMSPWIARNSCTCFRGVSITYIIIKN
jgi:hypothetical protein